jgi:uncharacterized membrane protein
MFNNKKPTRIKKFARYRQAILRMNSERLSNKQVFLAEDTNQNTSFTPIQIFTWLLGAGVIILLILVVALVYFGR